MLYESSDIFVPVFVKSAHFGILSCQSEWYIPLAAMNPSEKSGGGIQYSELLSTSCLSGHLSTSTISLYLSTPRTPPTPTTITVTRIHSDRGSAFSHGDSFTTHRVGYLLLVVFVILYYNIYVQRLSCCQRPKITLGQKNARKSSRRCASNTCKTV